MPMTFEQVQNYSRATAGFHSVHTEESAGFSWQPCALCRSTLGGERYPVHGLKPSERGGMESEYIGECCTDCEHEIEG